MFRNLSLYGLERLKWRVVETFKGLNARFSYVDVPLRGFNRLWQISGGGGQKSANIRITGADPENIEPGGGGRRNCINHKEVFVNHEQAPTAPKLEGVWVFVDLKYISYENRYFWPIWQLPAGCFLTEMVKRHIYGPRPFIWAYNQVSRTFRSKVLARTRKRWRTDGQTDGRTDTPTL